VSTISESGVEPEYHSTRQKDYQSSNSRFPGKNPCLARHAAQGEQRSPQAQLAAMRYLVASSGASLQKDPGSGNLCARVIADFGEILNHVQNYAPKIRDFSGLFRSEFSTPD
jgi:hypothetical protein